MGVHDIPFAYTIEGKPAEKKAKRGNYDDGIESFAAFEIVAFNVREVSEIETARVGILKNDTTEEDIRFFEGHYWIKDAYSEDEKPLRRSCCKRVNDLDGGGSLFRDSRGGNGFETDFRNRAHRDVTQAPFKKITENNRDNSYHRTRDNVNDSLIEIDGVLYAKVQEPVFELYAYEDNSGPSAFVSINLDYKRPTYKSSRYDDVFRFAFDQRPELELFIDHIERELNIKVQISCDGEFYYGGEFQRFDDHTNLLAAAEPIVEETSWMKQWSTAKLTAWGNLRDAFEEAKAPNASDDVIRQLADKLGDFGKIEDLSFNTKVAIFKWGSRDIPLVDIDIDLSKADQPTTMGL